MNRWVDVAEVPQQISSIVNRSPPPGERHQYDFNKLDASHTIYGVVALRPNLRGSGKVLLLEGTSMAETEAAADFVFDDAHLLPFLAKIRIRMARYRTSRFYRSQATWTEAHRDLPSLHIAQPKIREGRIGLLPPNDAPRKPASRFNQIYCLLSFPCEGVSFRTLPKLFGSERRAKSARKDARTHR
jgi:hypothetical protein